MYKYLLQSVDGVQWFGVAALLIFFGVFCVALFRVFFTSRSDLDAAARLPFDDAKYPVLALLFITLPGGLFAQAAEPAAPATSASFAELMTWALALAGGLVFVVAMIYVIKVNQFLYKRVMQFEAARAGLSLPEPEAAVRGDGLWTRLRKKYWEDPIPLSQENSVLLHHDYDGIRELDNSLPPWWVNLFYITIAWALGYMIYYHWGGNGPSSAQEYQQQVEQASNMKAAALARQTNAVDENSVTLLTESSALSEGELIYKNNCIACHGAAGQGTVGPNLCDEYWLHGGGIKNVFKTIKYGVPEKGMISWQAQLKAGDIQKVASYLLTFQGTKPADGKAPQGEIWKEEGAEMPKDSLLSQSK